MATYTSIIDPDNGTGTDYTHLATWESSEQTTVTSGNTWVAECRCTGGTADSTTIGVHIDGWTFSGGDMLVHVPTTYRHQGVYPSSGNIYRLTTTSSWNNCLRVDDTENVTIRGICARAGVGNGNFGTTGTSNDNLVFDSCYAWGKATDDSLLRCWSATTKVAGEWQYYINNIAYEGSYGFALGGDVYNSYQAIYNNTAVNCSDDNFRVYTNTTYLKNNIAQDRSNYFYDAYGIPLDDTNNKETSGYSSSTMNVNLIEGAVTFSNESVGNLNLTSSDTVVLGKGLDLSNDPLFPFNYDYTGSTRSDGTYSWDLGAHQLTSSAPSEDISIVDPSNASGTDYTTIASWESTEQADITASGSDVIAVAECRGGQDDYNVSVNISGWTTSEINRIIIRNHASEPPNGYYDTSRYYIEFTTYNQRLNFSTVRHITIKGIQIVNNTNAQSGDAQYPVYFNSSDTTLGSVDLHFINNIVVNNETANASKAVFLGVDSKASQHRFIVIGNMLLTNEDGIELDIGGQPPGHYIPKIYVLNNTIVGDDIGIMFDGYMAYLRTNGTQWVRNNAIYVANAAYPYYPAETTADYYANDDDLNDYNFDNDPTALTQHLVRGSHGGYGTTFTFVDMTGTDESLWDIRLSSSDTGATGNGENLNDAVADFPQFILDYLERDITNTKRPPSGHNVAWDVGAHQVTKMPSGYHLMP
jgi:hypothetical protein